MNQFQKLSQSIAPAFNRAAPESLRWVSESAFFEKQIRDCKAKIDNGYRHVLLEGIEAGVEATIDSCRAAARQFASMGLSMNPSAKHSYFIPRRARERRDGEPWSEYSKVPWLVDPTPSYMGLCYIGTHYAGARVFGASEVYAGDVFIPKGPFELPHHRPTTDNTGRDERHAIGVYAAALLAGDITRSEYVDAPTVQRIRSLSKVPNSMMYTTLWTEGWKKIALRRLCKLVIQTNDRWLAAEEAMTKAEGFTFDNDTGEVLGRQRENDDVPRATLDADQAAVRVWTRCEEEATDVRDLSRRLHAEVEKIAQANGGPEVQGHCAQLRERLSAAGQADAATLRAVWLAEVRNASPGLREAVRGHVAVPRTSSRGAPARGMNGLRDRMQAAQDRVQDEPTPEAPEPGPPPLLALPAPSGHPEGSIEWWLDQLSVAPSMERMDEIRVAALEAKLDQGDDAGAFRHGYSLRAKQIRTGAGP